MLGVKKRYWIAGLFLGVVAASSMQTGPAMLGGLLVGLALALGYGKGNTGSPG